MREFAETDGILCDLGDDISGGDAGCDAVDMQPQDVTQGGKNREQVTKQAVE